MRRTGWAVLIGAVALSGCGGSAHKRPSSQEAAVTPSGKHVKLSTPGVPKGEQTVKLRVITAKGRNTIALVPIYINGRGPYPFALDTGASQSLIDRSLARDLGLRTLGPSEPLHGVTGGSRGQMVQVKNWRAGKVRLHADRIAALKLFDGARGGPAGLLGSDVLSRFGKIAVDYDKDVLLLDPPVK
ncbi:MAG TPA: retropepsin-like aspartic protease [Thermoleophilaceae bacterium]|nr:retropepsin-like aspartic protease [Thermoleophilaceae bacterium]